MRFSLIVLFSFLLFWNCSKTEPQAYSSQQTDSLKAVFAAHLDTINHEFLTANWSPLSDQDKAGFKGVKYFPYDVSWRFTGAIVRYEQQDSLTIRGSKAGDLRPALRYGYFRFTRGGNTHQLDIIKILPNRPGQKAHLFLGFWDETSDVETYGGGRYIDLKELNDGRYLVDFNFAYNPYYAYSGRYSCAIPPLTNRLPIPVNAGERKYKNDH